MEFSISFFTEKDRSDWERLILRDSVNGLFIQTRKFIDYHAAGKFKDASICIRCGDNLVGSILAAEVVEDGLKTFSAHPGTTFGGLTVTADLLNLEDLNSLIESVENFLREHGFQRIFLKLVPSIYSKDETEIIDYVLESRNYSCNSELNYVLDLSDEDPIKFLTEEKRRGVNRAMRFNLTFRPIDLITGGGGSLNLSTQFFKKI